MGGGGGLVATGAELQRPVTRTDDQRKTACRTRVGNHEPRRREDAYEKRKQGQGDKAALPNVPRFPDHSHAAPFSALPPAPKAIIRRRERRSKNIRDFAVSAGNRLSFSAYGEMSRGRLRTLSMASPPGA